MRNVLALLASAVLAIPSVGAPTRADARPIGHRFCLNGVRDNHDLADRLAQSIQRDGSGNTPLRGCVANPKQFLAAFQNGDPESAHLFATVGDLIAFLREHTRVVTITENARFYSSCVRGQSRDVGDVVMRCQPEQLQGVQVLVDELSGRRILILRCANPGLSPLAPPPCAYVIIEIRERGRLNIGDFERAGHEITPVEEAQCPTAITGPRHDGSFQPSDYRSIGMEEIVCDFSEIEHAFDMRVRRQACLNVEPGFYAVRVHYRHVTDENLRVFVCAFSEERGQSLGRGALPATYRRLSDRSAVSVIWYEEGSIPADYQAEQQSLEW